MRKSYVLLVLGIVVFLASCRKDPATLTLTVQPKWGTDNLQLNTTYAVNGGYLQFHNLGLYLSHIKLIKTDNSEVEADSVALMWYTGSEIKIKLSPIEGDYKGIKFGVGLDSIQNNINPADVDPQSAYYDNSLYWAMNLEHLFIQMEGASGTQSNLGSIFFYHIGTDPMYRTATANKTFSVSAGQNTSLTLNADVSKVFNGTNAVNVITEPTTHSTDNVATAQKVADNFSQIFTLQ